MTMPTRWVAHEIHGIGERVFHLIALLCGLDEKEGPMCFQWDSTTSLDTSSNCYEYDQ